jgi:hypothetical protein
MGLLLLLGGGSRGPRITDAYDVSELSSWHYGNTIVNGTAYNGMSGTDVRMKGFFTRLNLTAGTYYIDTFLARIAFMLNSCDLIELKICRKDGTDFTVVYSFDLTSQKPASDSTVSATFDLDDEEIVLESGVEYYFGTTMRGPSGRTSGRPGIRASTGRSTDATYTLETAGGVSSWPTTFTPSVEASGYQYHQQLLLKTKNRIVYSDDSLAVGDAPMIPFRATGLTYVKLSSVVVADGENLDFNFRLSDSTVCDKLTVDFVNDDIEIASTTQSLTGQDGDTFDLLCQFDNANDKSNVFYMNVTDGQGGEGASDITTISHAAKNSATRAANYTISRIDYSYVSIEGSGAVGKIEVGYEPVIIFGDSMATISGRIGAWLPSSFTYDRISWRAQISGNRLSVTSAGLHTAGYLRYESAAPGTADLCDLRDVVFCFGMYGLNDISRIGTTEANVATVTADYFQRVEEIVDDLVANGNQPLLIGLAPYHADPNASTLEAAAIIDWNRRYANLAIEKRVAWMNVWYDLVDKTTLGDAIPEILAAYTSDGGTHINSDAAEFICPLVAEAYESGYVGGLWDESFRRLRY